MKLPATAPGCSSARSTWSEPCPQEAPFTRRWSALCQDDSVTTYLHDDVPMHVNVSRLNLRGGGQASRHARSASCARFVLTEQGQPSRRNRIRNDQRKVSAEVYDEWRQPWSRSERRSVPCPVASSEELPHRRRTSPAYQRAPASHQPTSLRLRATAKGA